MNHHKFNYLSSAGVGRSGSNSIHTGNLTSARFAGTTHTAQSPTINFTSPLPTLLPPSSSPVTTTTTTCSTSSPSSSPSSSSSSIRPCTRYPIRLTPSALPYFISTIIYTIEFHAPVGPRPLPSGVASKSSSVTSRLFFNSGSNSNNYVSSSNNSTRSSLQGPCNSSIAIHDPRQSHLQFEDNSNISNNNINKNNISFAESTGMVNTLPSSVFSAVSAIFGRSPLQTLSPQLRPQNTSVFTCTNTNNNNNKSISFQCKDDLDLNEELFVDEEVLRRAREQPLVSPCTQIIHELGNVHIVVRERHNPTVEMAYNQALCDIRMILGKCREKMEKELRVRSQSQQQRFRSSVTASKHPNNNTNNNNNNIINETPTISVYGNECVSEHFINVPDYCYSGNSHKSSKSNFCQTDRSSRNVMNNNNNNNNSSRFAATSPPVSYSASSLLPLSEPPSLVRLESPCVRHGMNAIQGSVNVNKNSSFAPHVCYDVQPDEVGMYLSVRLLTRESKWILSHERPLAEWTFPLIRTCDEKTIKYCSMPISPLQPFSHNYKYTNNNYCTNTNTNNATKMSAYHRKESGLDENSGNNNSTVLPSSSSPQAQAQAHNDNACTDHVVRVNDANQIRDVLQFILKTFYDAISLQTFVDFTADSLASIVNAASYTFVKSSS